MADDDLISKTNFPGFSYDPAKSDTLIGQLDPFIGTVQQTSRMRAFCRIMIDGVDVTDKMQPHLISVHVIVGSPASKAEIELDDRDGILPIPTYPGGSATVALGWESEQMVTVFNGMIMDVEHGFGRKQGGRRMWIHASGANLLESKLKQPIQDHLGKGAPPGQKEGTMNGLPAWIKQLTQHAGVTAAVSGEFDKIQSDFWDVANASVMHQIETLAGQHGFVHLFTDGDKLLVEKAGERGLSCMAVWRDNLIGWRVRPFSARSAFSGAMQQWYDPQQAAWNFGMQAFGLQGPWNSAGSQVQPQAPAASETGANADNQGLQESAEASSFGNGRIMINGEPKARWNSHVRLVGARPGVDGLYLIKVVEHVYSRQGFVTTLEVMPWANAPMQFNVGQGWLPKPGPNIGGQ